MRVAYLVNQYPKVSHSFIRREIHALENLGIEIIRISIRGDDIDLVDAEDISERTKTRYVLQRGGLAVIVAVLQTLLLSTIRFFKSLSLAWRMGRHADRPRLVHLIYLAEACRIKLWLDDADVDHVHAHFGTNSAEVAMLVHSLGGPAWSFTVHGPEEFDKPQFIGLSEKIHRCAFVVAISSFGRSQLFRTVAREYWEKIAVVHCGIESRFHAPQHNETPFLPKRLVCIGRLCEQKGQSLLIEAMRLLTLRGVDAELVLAGDGEMRTEIEGLIKRYKLEARVRITGWISGSQVREELLSARAMVLPSFAEGLPVVIMEAMALKRPVISTYVAGIPELVLPREHGWLVPAGDVAALAQAMKECLETPVADIAYMGMAAYSRVTSRHDIQAEAEKLASLFKSVTQVGDMGSLG